jgi:hypothetical protein
MSYLKQNYVTNTVNVSFLDNWFYSLFPPMQYAFIVPAIYGLTFIGGLTIFTLYQFRDSFNILSNYHTGKYSILTNCVHIK